MTHGLTFSRFSFPFQRHRRHQHGYSAPGYMVSGVVYQVGYLVLFFFGTVQRVGRYRDGYVCE